MFVDLNLPSDQVDAHIAEYQPSDNSALDETWDDAVELSSPNYLTFPLPMDSIIMVKDSCSFSNAVLQLQEVTMWKN